VEVWDIRNFERLVSIAGSSVGAFYWQRPLALSRDGKRLLIANTETGYELWDVDEGACVTQAGEAQEYDALTFSPTDDRYAAANGPVVVIKDMNKEDEEVQLIGHVGRVFSMTFFPQGDMIATGSEDGSARVWDALNGEELRRIEGLDAEVTSVDVTPDCRRVVTGSVDGLVRLWDLWNLEELMELAKQRAGRELTERERRQFGLVD
jgi:WD40 repeat protein